MATETELLHYQIQLYKKLYDILESFILDNKILKFKLFQCNISDNSSAETIIDDRKNQETDVSLNNKKKKFEILFIDSDSNNSWREIVKDVIDDEEYVFDIASDYLKLLDKLIKKHYDVICLSDIDNWFNILKMLKKSYDKIPIIMISSNPFEEDFKNIQKRYPNIKKIICKSCEKTNSDFISDIRETMEKLFV